MSLIEELGAQLYASSAELPLGELVAALDKLRAGSALLLWVRQESTRPMGVPELSGAIEHLEHAARALHVAQDNLSGYLAAVGLSVDAARPPDTAWRAALDERRPVEPSASDEPAAPVAGLGRWWAERIKFLTDGSTEEPEADGSAGPPGTDGATGGAATGAELLRLVARRTGAADRDGLRRVLTDAPTPVGLDLAAVAPTVLHRLAGDLLGHQPRAEDLPALTRSTRERVQGLLPNLPPEVLDRTLAWICRVPPTEVPTAAPHPADSAAAAGVLVGVLLHRLGRNPDTLDPRAPEPTTGPDSGR
jgi:hypothetical protein